MEEAEGKEEGGSADTRKGRPAAAGERDRARGGRRRRHGAHTLAHTRSHSTPGRSPPEGPRGGRGERCNLLATVGNCKGARGPRSLYAQRAGPGQPGPDGACKPRGSRGISRNRKERGENKVRQRVPTWPGRETEFL